MAVYAAHLTRTLQGTPSVFTVGAQEALGATVKPALRKLIEYLAEVYPSKCAWTLCWFDELYLLLDCCLQYHYLKHYAASFSESFYGLLRVPITASSEFSAGPRLPQQLERASLVLLVLVPYIKDKIERIVEGWRDADEEGRLGKSRSAEARRTCVRLYALSHACASAVRLAQLLGYLTGRSASPTPELSALRLTLREAPPPEPEPDEHDWTDFGRSLLKGHFGSAVVTFPMVGAVVLRCAEYGAFAVQGLRFWGQRGGGAESEGRVVPPPPPRDERSIRWRNRCPLCLQTWRIPTVLPVSGLVFCYSCVSGHVRAHGRCPVTRCPASEASLVRLYVTGGH